MKVKDSNIAMGLQCPFSFNNSNAYIVIFCTSECMAWEYIDDDHKHGHCLLIPSTLPC